MTIRIPVADLEAFTTAVLVHAGACQSEARDLAHILVWCDAAGRVTQGVWRLELLAERLEKGGIRSPAAMTVEDISAGIRRINGADGFGHLVVSGAVDRAVDLAQKQGIGLVLTQHSNFCGALAYYSHRAAEAGCVSLICTNSFPKVVAHGGLQRVLGTNPFAFGAPAPDGEHLIVDLSTSASAGSTITKLAEEAQQLPEGIASDASGQTLQDPGKIADGAILPMAGAKGFGLGLMVELLAGVLSSAAVADDLKSLYEHPHLPGGNGQAVIVINVSHLMTEQDYFARFSGLRTLVLGSGDAVRMPGAARYRNARQAYSEGVALDAGTLAKLDKLAVRYQLQPLS